MKFLDASYATVIPTKIVGPILINLDGKTEEVSVPLATFETPLWNSVKRGALLSQKSGGIVVRVVDECMTRSSVVEANTLDDALMCKKWIETHRADIASAVASTSSFAVFKDVSVENVGRLLYIRLSITSGNASGHNMVTYAMDKVLQLIIANCDYVKYVSVSGNCCVDKKVSAVNGILGRGKRVSAEICVPKSLCMSILRTTPRALVDLNIKKNFVGSILAGGVRSANAHFANIVLAMYLATGQDAANIVEASQGITYAECDEDNLYFSVNLPNLIVGIVGSGKNLDFALDNLKMLKCEDARDDNAACRLAGIIAATVLCSELSLLAAQTNQGELMRTHIELERNAR